jgi:ubiquinone/menaquinone biosynthesis C-methylase UbiE
VADRWARWLLEGRHGGDQRLHERLLSELMVVRDRLLDGAAIKEGSVLLDVGCGDGLMAFGALERVGKTGVVIFTDISDDLLAKCRAMAEELGVLSRCRFVRAPAENLVGVDDAAVDMVTTRSVLIYVKDKPRAFSEFHRVLHPGGRIALHEPINRLMDDGPDEFVGFDVSQVPELAAKLKEARRCRLDPDDPMLDFDERDLVHMAEKVGFTNINLEMRLTVAKEPLPITWEAFLSSSPNPLAPTRREFIENVLTPSEVQTFYAHLKPVIEAGTRIKRLALADLWADKT